MSLSKILGWVILDDSRAKEAKWQMKSCWWGTKLECEVEQREMTGSWGEVVEVEWVCVNFEWIRWGNTNVT